MGKEEMRFREKDEIAPEARKELLKRLAVI